MARTFTVLSQTVRVTDSTLFDESVQPAELESLNAGAVVQVSGFTNAAGEIVAQLPAQGVENRSSFAAWQDACEKAGLLTQALADSDDLPLS